MCHILPLCSVVAVALLCSAAAPLCGCVLHAAIFLIQITYIVDQQRALALIISARADSGQQ